MFTDLSNKKIRCLWQNSETPIRLGGKILSETIYAWTAGIIESDGNLGLYKRIRDGKKKSPEAQIKVGSGDKLIVLKLRDTFGGSFFHSRYENMYRWSVSHRKALDVAKAIAPYIVSWKQACVKQILSWYHLAISEVQRSNEADYAWATGLIEGDGWIGTKASCGTNRKRRLRPMIRVFNQDMKILSRLKQIFHGSVSCFHKAETLNANPKHTFHTNKDIYAWEVQWRLAFNVAHKISPYIVGQKKERVNKILAFYPKPWKVTGQSLNPKMPKSRRKIK